MQDYMRAVLLEKNCGEPHLKHDAATVGFDDRSAASRALSVDLHVDDLHHILDTDRILRAFYALLDTSGYLCVADQDTEDGTFHEDEFHPK